MDPPYAAAHGSPEGEAPAAGSQTAPGTGALEGGAPAVAPRATAARGFPESGALEEMLVWSRGPEGGERANHSTDLEASSPPSGRCS